MNKIPIVIPIRDALEPEFKIVQIDIKVPTDDTNVNILVFNSKFRNVFLMD